MGPGVKPLGNQQQIIEVQVQIRQVIAYRGVRCTVVCCCACIIVIYLKTAAGSTFQRTMGHYIQCSVTYLYTSCVPAPILPAFPEISW